MYVILFKFYGVVLYKNYKQIIFKSQFDHIDIFLNNIIKM
jgi:hypothetical protein